MADEKPTRRHLIALAAAGIAAVPALAAARVLGPAGAVGQQTPATPAAPAPAGSPGEGELPHLDEKDKKAVSLGYVHDATKVDKGKNPKFDSGQTCGTCRHIEGEDEEAWRPCKLFPGKAVNTNGWCKFWVKKA